MSRSAGAGRPTRSTSIRCPAPRRRLRAPTCHPCMQAIPEAEQAYGRCLRDSDEERGGTSRRAPATPSRGRTCGSSSATPGTHRGRASRRPRHRGDQADRRRRLPAPAWHAGRRRARPEAAAQPTHPYGAQGFQAIRPVRSFEYRTCPGGEGRRAAKILTRDDVATDCAAGTPRQREPLLGHARRWASGQSASCRFR
jgi:hypothetical protein